MCSSRASLPLASSVSPPPLPSLPLSPPLRALLDNTVVSAYNSLQQMALLPSWLPMLASTPIEPFNITSFALSLLLVFRTNTSYSRYDEGRRKFGAIMQTCRSIARQLFAYLKPEQSAEREACVRWMMALCRASMVHLRGQNDVELRQELQGVLPPAEMEALLASFHKPNYCLMMLAQIVEDAHMEPIHVSRPRHTPHMEGV